MSSKFGELLLWDNVITEEQLQDALSYQQENGGKLGEILNHLGYISDDDVTRTLGIKYGVPTVKLDQLEIDHETLELIPPEMARSCRVIPLGRIGSTLTCALEDATRIDVINTVEFQTGCNLQPVLVTPAMMTAGLERYYPAVRPSTWSASTSPAVKSTAISEILLRLQQLSPEKLDDVRRFLDSLK